MYIYKKLIEAPSPLLHYFLVLLVYKSKDFELGF